MNPHPQNLAPRNLSRVCSIDGCGRPCERHRVRADGVEMFRTKCSQCKDRRPHELRLSKRRARRHRLRARYDALKSGPCADCGQIYPPGVMDFHHRPGETKAFEIGWGWSKKRWDMVLWEVMKCDLLCANCHRMRTLTRPPRA